MIPAKFLRTSILCSAIALGLIPHTVRAGQNETQPTTREGSKTAASRQPSGQDIANAQTQGLVWANTKSHKYYKGGEHYGKTKNGKFMSEAEARKQGYSEAKEPPDGNPVPHKNDQSGVDSTPNTHSSTPPKQ